ncbi:hypothetical protein Q3G72_023068 [Acer saccharum]|nr:hypothetical protein Q3G72_023068 [Acer saccharum]
MEKELEVSQSLDGSLLRWTSPSQIEQPICDGEIHRSCRWVASICDGLGPYAFVIKKLLHMDRRRLSIEIQATNLRCRSPSFLHRIEILFVALMIMANEDEVMKMVSY